MSESSEWVDTTSNTTAKTSTTSDNITDKTSTTNNLEETTQDNPHSLTHKSPDNPSPVNFDERPLPHRNNDSENKPIIGIKPKDSVYILIKDGRVICFSTSRADMKRMVAFYKRQIYDEYKDSKLSSEFDNDTLCIYERSSTFIFNYNNLISTFKILKVPHYRTRMFHEKENRND